MPQTTPQASWLNQKCQEAIHSTWINKGFKVNPEVNQCISSTSTIQDLIIAIHECPGFDYDQHHETLSQALDKIKQTKATLKPGEKYPKELTDDLLSTFAVIGSKIFYSIEAITMGKKPEDRPLTKERAALKFRPAKAKATTRETFTVVNAPTKRSSAMKVPGAFPTPIVAVQPKVSFALGRPTLGNPAYDPDDDPDLEMVSEEEEEAWDLVSEDEGEDFVVLGEK